jgi:methylmalonyl-CoA/ethylmalonyl-CoA epimerase
VLDHIGIAVRDAAGARRLYEALGFHLRAVETVPSQQVTTTFLELDGLHVELLEPTGEGSPVAKTLDKRGEGVHHLAFRVPSLEAAADRLRAQGYTLLYETPQPGAGGKRINFLHPKDGRGVLIELCEGD